MPLSDAARALLAGRAAVKPGQPAPPPEPEPEPEPDADRTGFRARAKAEAERFRLATDSEYWICLCFRTPGAVTSFCEAAGITPDGRYFDGRKLTRVSSLTLGSRVQQMLAARSSRGTDITAQLTSRPAASPLEGLPALASIEQDSLIELEAILTALTAPPDLSPVNILDSPHWLAACWPHRDAKDEWLAETGVEVFGDKYVDGHKAAAHLGYPLKEV